MAKRETGYGRTEADLVETIDSAGGDSLRGRVHHPVDVRAIRKASGMTQQAFARTFGSALRDWEQGRKRPERTARLLLRVIAVAPDTVARAASGS